MSDVGDTADRESFSDWTRDLLTQSASFLNLREVAKVGRSRAVLTPMDVIEIERRSRLPKWLADRLGPMASDQPSTNYHEQVVVAGQLHSCRAPVRLGDLSPHQGFNALNGRSPDIRVIHGNNGTFLLQNFLKAGFVADGYIPAMTDVDNRWCWDIFRKQEPRHLPGRTLICVVEGSSVFTHWLFDTLPRFEIARMAGVAPRDFDHIVVVTKRSGFQQETLAALDIPDDIVRQRSDIGPVIACDEFYWVSPVRQVFFAQDWLYKFVYGLLGPARSGTPPTERIYISRSKASRRRLVNEEQLYPVLAKHGFRIVHAESLSLKEMAGICANTSHIVAPHGAGLANLVFLPPGARLLEIYGAHLSTEYWRMCNALGHEYYYLQGSGPDGGPVLPERISQMGYFERNALDIHLDPSVLEQSLQQVLDGASG